MSAVSKASASIPAPPPSAAEIQRKLSMHAQSPPSHRRRPSASKSPTVPSALSGTESDSDAGNFSPPATQGVFPAHEIATTSQQVQAQQPPPSALPNPVQNAQPLSVIAERPGGSGEESDDDDDEEEDWNPAAGRSLEELANLNDESIAKAGYLYKKGERRKTWKKRWFVLRQTQLSYYKSDKEYKLLRLLPMADIHSVTPVTLKKHHHTFGMVTPSRTFYVQAESAAEADSWVRALNEAKSRLAGSTAGQAGTEGRKHVPPTINIQRSTTGNLQATEPRTPPAVQQGFTPSSPNNPQQNFTSSDSEDPDSYAPASPAVPRATGHFQAASDREPRKTILQGYLMKCGSKRKNWRKRFFVLTPDTLVYAKSHMDINNGKPGKNGKVVPLEAILDAIECTIAKHGHGLGLGVGGEKTGGASVGVSASVSGAGQSSSYPGTTHPMAQTSSAPNAGASSAPTDVHNCPQHTFKIVTPKRPLVLCAPSEEEEIKWLSAVRALIARRNVQPGDVVPPTPGPQRMQASPNKRASRREMAGSSSSSSPPRDNTFVIPPAQSSAVRRKESTSLTATAMAIAPTSA